MLWGLGCQFRLPDLPRVGIRDADGTRRCMDRRNSREHRGLDWRSRCLDRGHRGLDRRPRRRVALTLFGEPMNPKTTTIRCLTALALTLLLLLAPAGTARAQASNKACNDG